MNYIKYLKTLWKKETYGGTALDRGLEEAGALAGDLDEAGALARDLEETGALVGDLEEAGALALSPFETGTRVAAAVIVSELKNASQANRIETIETDTYTAVSKTSWWADFKTFEEVEGSLARGFFGLSRVGLTCWSHQ